MGGEETTKSPLRGDFWYMGRTPERVASNGKEEVQGGGGGRKGGTDGVEDNGRAQRDRGEEIGEIRGGKPMKASN